LAFESHHAPQQSAKTAEIEREAIKSSHRAIFFARRHQIRIHSTYPSIRAIDSFEESRGGLPNKTSPDAAAKHAFKAGSRRAAGKSRAIIDRTDPETALQA
jgi:hypothetical protein